MRVIPITNTLYRTLVDQRKFCDGFSPDVKKDVVDGYSDFIFIRHGKHNEEGRLLGYRGFYDDLVRISLNNQGRNVVLPRVTPHVLRHCFITNLCSYRALDPKEIIMLTGHKNVAIPLKIYDHVSKERLSEAFNSFDQWQSNR